MNIFKKLFGTKQEKPLEPQETYIDILISLNKNFEFELSLFMDCDYKKHNIDLVDYIILCSRFLNLDSDKLKKQILDILDNQIKNKENQQLVNGLISVLKIETITSTIDSMDNTYIKPTQVFTKQSNEHQ